MGFGGALGKGIREMEVGKTEPRGRRGQGEENEEAGGGFGLARG